MRNRKLYLQEITGIKKFKTIINFRIVKCQFIKNLIKFQLFDIYFLVLMLFIIKS